MDRQTSDWSVQVRFDVVLRCSRPSEDRSHQMKPGKQPISAHNVLRQPCIYCVSTDVSTFVQALVHSTHCTEPSVVLEWSKATVANRRLPLCSSALEDCCCVDCELQKLLTRGIKCRLCLGPDTLSPLLLTKPQG
jgi:hypothetical protein